MKKILLWPLIAVIGLTPYFIASAQTQEITETEMQAAYEHLKHQITTNDEKVALAQSQSVWLKDRDAVCSAKPVSCLVQKNIARRYFLEGRSVDGLSASSAIRPFFTYQPDSKGGVEISATQLKFINPKTPAELALNGFMDKQLQEATGYARDTNFRSKDEEYYSLMGSELNFVSSELLSTRVDGSYFVGQAHPEPWGQSLNMDMRTGKTLQFNDLFAEDKAREIFNYCQKQINDENIKNQDDPKKGDDFIKEISESTSDLGIWSFDKNGASVNYSPYAFGGYGQCNCSCKIPYAVLYPLAKKTFPLPREK